jgi:hypothetical protein
MTGPADAARLDGAFAAIDAANGEDPNIVELAGERGPKELLHGRRAAQWVSRLDPAASDVQLLAARAHHFRRWTRPRGDYPDGRAGYLRWRKAAKDAHAVEVGAVLTEAGYDPADVERVGSIIRKEGLARDTEVQTHEDALCLVFLEAQFDDLAGQLGDDHTVEVLVKTLHKMSRRGIVVAAGLPLSENGSSLLARAVAAAG